MLQVQNLDKFYGNFQALRNISFKINKGDIVGFLGPNGSGKTTTIKVLAGLLPNYKGEIQYKQNKVNHIGSIHNTCFIFDSQNFYNNLTAYENLKIIGKLNKNYNRKKVLNSLENIGLSKWKNTKVNNFSRGMRQRLALASAEYYSPELLILDEPTNGLDINGISELEDYFIKLNKEKECTILLSSHYLEQVERLSNHIIMIDKGKKKFDGSIEELTNHKRIGVSYVVEKNDFNLDRIKKISFVKDINIVDNIIDIYLKEFKNEFIYKLNQEIIQENIQIRYIIPIERTLSDFFINEIERKD